MTYKQYLAIKNNKEMLTIESKIIESQIKEANRFLSHLENSITILKMSDIKLADVIKLAKQMQVKWTTKDIQDMLECKDFLLSSSESLQKEALLLNAKLEIAKKKESNNLELYKQFEIIEAEKEIERANKLKEENKKKVKK